MCSSPCCQGQPHSTLCALSCKFQIYYASTLDPSFSDEASSALANCVQMMPQLRTLVSNRIKPLPVLQSLSHRGSLLDSVTVNTPLWVCMVHIHLHFHVLQRQRNTFNTIEHYIYCYIHTTCALVTHNDEYTPTDCLYKNNSTNIDN